jgi:multiple sugar transport system permease protein
MPIVSRIGRRSWRVRLQIGIIYALLLTGAVTMVYPFLLMLAGSTKSAVDARDLRLVPAYLVDDAALYRKYLEGLFNESIEACRVCYGTDLAEFALAPLPPPDAEAPLTAAWERFLAETPLPLHAWGPGFVHAGVSRGVFPHHFRAFKRRLHERFAGDIVRVNRELATTYPTWNSLYLVPESYLARRSRPVDNAFYREFNAFKQTLPLTERDYFSVEGYYRTVFLKNQYGRDIAHYNETHGTAHARYEDIRLPRRAPDGPGHGDAERTDWETFVRTLVSLVWVRGDAAAAPGWRAFLEAKHGDLATLNGNHGTAYRDFAAIPFPEEPPTEGIARSDWDAYLQGWHDPDTGVTHLLPLAHVRLHSVEFQFRDWLAAEHGTVAAANAALGTAWGDWLEASPPQRALHHAGFLRQRAALRWEFTRRNYLVVLDLLILRGRGLLNTAIYCTLAILAALIVNPLAAYALSRYKPPSAYKFLLFLMMTMAFPPMVTQIPVFLMLRSFGLLNTYWALILPGLANGYAIFLLKGFFDSLPQELYESAALDGAGEMRIFWTITMSLSKPILAVIALNAFVGAYSNFMFALLICQNEKMWTLMPWLYQLQQRSGPGVIFASLIVAAIPTFIVFALCQNVIMRGIVVPVEK